MKRLVFAIMCCAVLAAARGFADDEAHAKRFYAGKVLMAEIKPISSSDTPKITNISEFAPPVPGDEYALITVKLDPKRSIGVYDYVLTAGSDEYPCVAIAEDGIPPGGFDASVWEIKNTSDKKKYLLLFKLSSPVHKKYTLKFKLRPNAGLDPELTFVNVKDKPFTKAAKVPDDGMLGINPYAAKPKPKKTADSKKAASEKKTASKAKEQKKKTATNKKKDKHAADRAAWEAFIKGDPLSNKKEGGGE